MSSNLEVQSTNNLDQKPRMVLNPNKNIVDAITSRIIKNDGHCPCQPRVEGDDNYTMCPCVPFMKSGHCCCKLYVKIEEAYGNVK